MAGLSWHPPQSHLLSSDALCSVRSDARSPYKLLVPNEALRERVFSMHLIVPECILEGFFGGPISTVQDGASAGRDEPLPSMLHAFDPWWGCHIQRKVGTPTPYLQSAANGALEALDIEAAPTV